MGEIGARLRDARIGAGIDIDEAEVRTKIRAKYLRAMENEDWGLLPGDVYVRSFLRSYGQALGLDTRALIDDFRRQYETPADHEPPPIVPPSRQSDRRHRGRGGGGAGGARVAPWVATALVLVVVVVVLVIVGTTDNSSNHDTTPKVSRVSRTRHHAQRHVARRHRPRPAPVAPGLVKLTLTPSGPGEVYVCLEDGAGKVLIPARSYAPGETIPVKSAPKLLLTLGNAAITIKANGVPVPVAVSATAIGLEFTPGHHVPLAPGQQPTCR